MKKLKRIFSVLLIVSIILSMWTITVTATEPVSSEDQIEKAGDSYAYHTLNDAGESTATSSDPNTYSKPADPKVTISAEFDPTDTENKFNIRLTVDTKQEV
jgi:predicted amidohydrolase YtcJ